MRRCRHFLVALSVLLLGTPASAPAQSIAERPVFKAGDHWLFKHTRVASDSGATSGEWSRTIDRVLPDDRLEVRWANNTIQYHDHAMNYVGPSPGGDVRLFARFPMQVGDTWSYSRRFEHPGFEEKGTVKVVTYEQVSVPAGTFDCYRVEVDFSLSAQVA